MSNQEKISLLVIAFASSVIDVNEALSFVPMLFGAISLFTAKKTAK